MKKFMKLTVLLLAVAMVVLCLVGCGEVTVVTFSANGEVKATAIADAEGKVYEPGVATADGSYIEGWYTSDGANGEWGTKFDFATAVTESKTLYAKVLNRNYTVTYDLGYTPTDATIVVPPTGSYNLNGKFNAASEPVRVGYVFKGWTDGEDVYQAGAEYTVSNTDNITLVATWEYKMLTVTFYNDVGQSEIKTVPYNGDCIAPDNLWHSVSFCFEISGWIDCETKEALDLTAVKTDLNVEATYNYLPTTDDIFVYELNDEEDGYIVSVNDDATWDYAGDVAFPETYNELPCKTIENASLMSANGDLYVPGCYELAKRAFESSAFANVYIAEGVTTIDEDAFYDVGIEEEVIVPGQPWPDYENWLESITLPSTLTEIAYKALPTNVREVNVAEGGKLVYENGLYIYDNNKLVGAVKNALPNGKLIIPATITEITTELFYNRKDLLSIEVLGQLTSIGESAFDNCGSLTSITFGRDAYVETIEEGAFRMCQVLDSVTLPHGIKSLGIGAFSRCFKLHNFSIANTIESIGDGAIAHSEKSYMRTLVMTGGTTSVNGKYVLQDGVLIEKGTSDVMLSDGVTHGDTMLLYCQGNTAKTYTTPETVRSFWSFCFSSQVFLEELTISEGVKLLPNCFASGDYYEGETGFNPSSSLKKVVFPESLTTIRQTFDIITSGNMRGPGWGGIIMMGTYSPFMSCQSLKEVVFPENCKLTEIPSMAFLNCAIEEF